MEFLGHAETSKKKKIETIHPGEKYEINANNLIHFSVKQEKYMALFYD